MWRSVTSRPTEPSSAAQFASSEAGELPAPDVVRDGIWSVAMPQPAGPPYSLTYLVEDSGGALHVIDTGWPTDENWMRLESALADTNHTVADVASVTATHLHVDHLGTAERIRAASGARIALLGREQVALDQLAEEGMPIPDLLGWGVPQEAREALEPFLYGAHYTGMQADVLLDDGQALDIPGRDIRVISTPGHTTGHISLRATDEKLLFTGDHVLPKIFGGIGLGGPSENPIADYLDSLDRVSVFDDHEVCPGHGYRFLGIAHRCAETKGHQLKRTGEVESIVAADPDATVWEVASRVTWTDGWANLVGLNQLSALAQTHMRVAFTRGPERP